MWVKVISTSSVNAAIHTLFGKAFLVIIVEYWNYKLILEYQQVGYKWAQKAIQAGNNNIANPEQ